MKDKMVKMYLVTMGFRGNQEAITDTEVISTNKKTALKIARQEKSTFNGERIYPKKIYVVG